MHQAAPNGSTKAFYDVIVIGGVQSPPVGRFETPQSGAAAIHR